MRSREASMKTTLISVVVPVLNETESLDQLYAELVDVATQHDFRLQIIFVDDGSTDDSWKVIERLAAADARVEGIRFRRNFGKAAALSAGFDAAHGERVMTLDADLQDDPAEISRFIEKIDQGYDVVSGWKQVRHDPWHKVIPSRIFNTMVSRLTGVSLHDHNCGMKCYRRDVIHEVRIYGELHRFVPVLAAARGYRIGELTIQHRPRQHGYSKYGWNRLIKGFLDLLTVKFLTGFGQRPQHMLGTIGIGSFFLGTLGLVYLAILWIISRMDLGMDVVHLHERPALYYSLVLFLIGGQMMSMGFLGELITAHLGHEVDSYSIAEHTPTAEDSRPEDFHNNESSAEDAPITDPPTVMDEP